MISIKVLRTVEQVFPATPTKDGDGVKIRRVAGRGILAALDPFLINTPEEIEQAITDCREGRLVARQALA